MSSNNICSVPSANDENSNSLISSGCKTLNCHCEGNGIVTSNTSSPMVTQKCYVTNSGCHEAVVTTTTQEVKRHKCPPKIQKVHEHINQPIKCGCSSQIGGSSCGTFMNSCPCNLGFRNSCCKTNICQRSFGNIQGNNCHGHSTSLCSCSCCCSTSTVQTTLYPIFMSFPYNQGRSIDVPYTAYSLHPNGAYYQLPENQYTYQL
ncbi:cysteine-rich protein [Cryptosporidium felis]|nr:cysteine-rich protein [Cryptosporidium felis]